MMQTVIPEINRGDYAHTSISSDRSARFFEFCSVHRMLELTITAPGSEARYCCNGRLPDGYHHDQS